MSLNVSVSDLLDYSEWEREQWHEWLRNQGDPVLKTSVGPNGDGRFQTVGDAVKHIFSAEKRYVDRLSEQALTDTGSVPADNIEALFQFGQQSRKDLLDFIERFPSKDWDVINEYKIYTHTLKATPRKIILHVVMHEIRHWAQIATVFRYNGLTSNLHDLLFSPVLAGGREKENASA
jgi:uncharacterized damage-inducible protein DinB